ncbi:hypothetical protein GF406_21520 [candidate division KSB1 bacterium]|nr:hypothetical protein [candidate division KSB1 bacterium]
MDKNHLLEMAGDSDLIPGIYNWCDRWCERCTLTSRCLQFNMEKNEKQTVNALASDEKNAEFWAQLLEPLVLTMELIRDMAERNGIDLDSIEVEAEMDEQKRNHQMASEHYCSRAALTYAGMVDEWFHSAKELLQEKENELHSIAQLGLVDRDPQKEANEITDASEVIRWYQHFLYPKIMRALLGKLRKVPPILEEMPTDFNGSAKIALIAIDRSIAAWYSMLCNFREKEDDTLRLLVHLEQLSNALESAFPAARAFVRPGFKE